MHKCHECQGHFPTRVSLAQHLIDENMLKVLRSQAAARIETSSGSSVQQIPSVATSGLTNTSTKSSAVKYFGAEHSHTQTTPKPTLDIASVDWSTEFATLAPALANGIITKYEVRGAFGTIVMIDGSAAGDIHFKIESCDIRRPPPTIGERVVVSEIVGSESLTAQVVWRVSVSAEEAKLADSKHKYKSKSSKKKTQQSDTGGILARDPPAIPDPDRMAELSIAMNRMRAADNDTPRSTNYAEAHQPIQVREAQFGSAKTVPAAEYEAILECLYSPGDCELFLPSALEILRRTRPDKASNIEKGDAATQLLLLRDCLQDELKQVSSIETKLEVQDDDNAIELNFGYTLIPSPVAGTRN